MKKTLNFSLVKQRDIDQKMGFFKHDQAICESTSIGDDTKIWAFAHVLPGAKIGRSCNICDHVFIENDVVIGNNVTIKCGVQLWDGVSLEDEVFIGPNATFSNDIFPRSKKRPAHYLKTIVQKGASLGANCTVLPGITVGQLAMVGAGAVVTKNVPPYAIVTGNPAKITGYARTAPLPPSDTTHPVAMTTKPDFLISSKVQGVRVVQLPVFSDMRGSLTVGEIGNHCPFNPRRYFIVFDVPSNDVRGEHAHRTLHQFLVCVKGKCSLVVDDGALREEFLLDSPTKGVHLPPMIWGTQYKFSSDAVLFVLASDFYDSNDYIRDYDDFISVKKQGSRTTT